LFCGYQEFCDIFCNRHVTFFSAGTHSHVSRQKSVHGPSEMDANLAHTAPIFAYVLGIFVFKILDSRLAHQNKKPSRDKNLLRA